MIIITKTKRIKKSEMPKMPDFEHWETVILWLRGQKRLAAIANIKSVSVQIKDIKQMIYSDNTRLVSLYAKLHFHNSSYSDNDYITITKSTSFNKSLMYDLISADWLLNIEDVEKKTIEELQQEYNVLQNKICELKRRNQLNNRVSIDYKIKLFGYKLSCLSEVTLNKIDSESNLEKSAMGRVLLKEKSRE